MTLQDRHKTLGLRTDMQHQLDEAQAAVACLKDNLLVATPRDDSVLRVELVTIGTLIGHACGLHELLEQLHSPEHEGT